jgi:lysyl-tRNA synthetase class 2
MTDLSSILLVLIFGKSEAELFDAARGMGIDVDATMGKGKLIDEIFWR